MDKIKIAFGAYCALPKGINISDWEGFYQDIIKPVLTSLYGYSDLDYVLYFSGDTLKWLDKKHPEVVSVLAEMVKKKQAEMLGGAFHEPFFPMIPGSDKVGQIELMTTFLRKTFGKRSRGFWIPELVWESSYTSLLKRSGIEYTFLPDSDLLNLGISPKSTYRVQNVEDQGRSIQVIPLWKEGRGIASLTPEAIIEQILNLKREGARAMSLMFEPFELKGKHKTDNRFDWLEQLLTLFREHSHEIELVLPVKGLKDSSNSPSTHYFEATSLDKYARWGRLANSPLGRGSFKNLLSFYRDVQLVYSKMNYVHTLVMQIKGDKSRKKSAREQLWKGQIHQSFCCGRYGGIADPELRHQVYRNLLDAEKYTREKGVFLPAIIQTDFDTDGKEEFLYQGYDYNAYVHIMGGVLFEFDYLPISWNVLGGFSSSSVYEGSIKNKAFHDHFFPDHLSPNEWRDTLDIGDFAYRPYRVLQWDKERHTITMVRRGSLMINGKNHALRIKKQYLFKRRSIEVHYEVENASTQDLRFTFAPEVNIALQDMDERHTLFQVVDGNRMVLEEDQLYRPVPEINIQDPKTRTVTTLSISQNAHFFIKNNFTNVDDDLGPRELYQSTALTPYWIVNIPKGNIWNLHCELKVTRK